MSAPLPPPVVPGTPPPAPVPHQPPPLPQRPPTTGLSTTSYMVILGLVGLAALGVIAALLLGGDRPGATDPNRGGTPLSDVKMDSCVITSYDSPKAILSVRNSTQSERDYVITVVFERSGRQIGSGVATVVDLRPGQTADAEAVGFGTDTTGSIRCRVSNVRRF